MRTNIVELLSWEGFQWIFIDKYSLASTRIGMEREFLYLTQEDHLVAQYEANFIKSSCDTHYLMAKKGRKAIRFQQCSNEDICRQLVPFNLKEYGVIVKCAQLIKHDRGIKPSSIVVVGGYHSRKTRR
ncbi:hypothetical protein Nepgr_018889 [Nepenthes gracilis]|uniref:Uncharacterized protein n=1 Tax=Nepenthes gracilis TaxID=150966 RepID=A0AAD3SSY7_NEPGR|nr:hypothetical protein Nepgr_018889 [Nepenthes gracilis]